MAEQVLTREYLEEQITKCRSAIAFASPKADMTFARAKLDAALLKLDALDRAALAA
jgi:hypothetical protein